MNFKKLNVIKESLSCFDDCEFESLLGEDSAVVRNRQGSLYSVPFTWHENNNVIFHGEKAKKLAHSDEPHIPTLRETISDKVHLIRESIKNYFESDDTSDLNDAAENLDYIELIKEDKLNQYNEEVSSVPQDSYEFSRLSDDEKETVRSLYDSVSRKQNEYLESKNLFMTNGRLFKENGKVRRTDFLNPLKVAELYKEKQRIRNLLAEQDTAISDFLEKTEDILNISKEQRELLFEGINLYNEHDFKTELAKNLVILKKKSGEAIDISVLSRKINEIYSETFRLGTPESHGEELKSYEEMISTLTSDSNSEERSPFRFLKFRMGIYSAKDLSELRSEFDQVIKTCYGMSRDALMTIQDMRDKIDFMLKTGRIDDEQVGEIIRSFNSSFGEAEKTEAPGISAYVSDDEEEEEDDDDLEDYESDDEDDYENEAYTWDNDEEDYEDEYEESVSQGPTDLNSALERAKEKVRLRKEGVLA